MEYPSLLLLLVLASSVFSVRTQCPSMEDINPCECEDDFIREGMRVVCEDGRTSLNELKSALRHFSKEEEIFSIALKNLNLGTIPSNLFEGIAIKQMSISNCEIDFEYGKPPLKGLEDSLQVLSITSSLTQKNVPLYLKLGHLKELKNLLLSDNKITELRDDMFDDKMPNLYYLGLNDNLIEKIGENVFENLTNIQTFALRGNKLGSLRRNMIPTSTTQLIRLWLNNNGLQDLPDDFFTSMPSLATVSLAQNKFQTLDQKTWENIVEQLDNIFLHGNPIQCDSEMEWLINSSVSADTFTGTCAGPTNEKGLSISRFISNGRQKV